VKIISEIGINHNGDFRKIEELIRQSAVGGADYAKFQLYDSVRVFGDESRKHNEFTFCQVKQIRDMCEVHGIEFFASVFDEEKIDWCETLGVNLYKIASRTIVKEPALCEKVISTNKLTYISLGMWRNEWLPFEYDNVKYFNCISKYPTSFLDLQKFYYSDNIVGFSDHSYGPAYALYNVAHGAQVIEKHFTLNKGMEGNDHIGSMDLSELKMIREYGQQFNNISKVAK
jgi:N,N'-diacetyllegionaminate synthase